MFAVVCVLTSAADRACDVSWCVCVLSSSATCTLCYLTASVARCGSSNIAQSVPYSACVRVAGQNSNSLSFVYVKAFQVTNVTVNASSPTSLSTVGSQLVTITGMCAAL